GDAVDLLRADEVGDLFGEGGLVDLVRKLSYDDRRAAVAHLLERALCAHNRPAATVGVHLANSVDLLPLTGQRVAPLLEAEDRAACWGVGTQDVVGHLVPCEIS